MRVLSSKITAVVASAAIALAGAGAAGAQAATTPTKPFSLGISGGASVPTGDLSSGTNSVNTGYNLGGHVAIATPSLPVSFRGDAGYNNWGSKDASFSNMHVWSFTGNAVYSIPTASMRPYLIGGIGAYSLGGRNLVRGGTINTGYNEGNTRFGYNLGGGVTLPLSGFNTFVEARYHHVNLDGGNSLAYVPITFGVMF